MNKKTDSLKPTCSTSASQSTEFDLAEDGMNLDRPNKASDDIAKILPPNRLNNVDKLQLLKNAFRPVRRAVMASNFEKCCTLLKDNNFVIST